VGGGFLNNLKAVNDVALLGFVISFKKYLPADEVRHFLNKKQCV